MTFPARQASIVIALLSASGPAAAQPEGVDAKITELDGIIEVVTDVRNLQQAIHDVKEQVRLTDDIEKLAGKPGAGLGFELRNMRDLLVKLDANLDNPRFGLKGASEQTRMAKGVELGRTVHAALSAADALTALISGTQETTPGQKLKLMGQYIGALNDAFGVLGLAVNPVLDAMLATYGQALVTAGEFADQVVAPRTRAINDAIDAAGTALGSGGGAGSSPAVKAYDKVLDELWDMRAELERKRTDLENRPNVDVVNAQKVCLRQLGITIEQVIDQENELRKTRHELMRIESGIRDAKGRILANQMLIPDKEAELRTQQDRQRRRIISAESRDPATVQAELDALKNEIEYAREKIRRLEKELRAKHPAHEEKLRGPQRYKDCLRSTLTKYAQEALKDLPIQYRDCTFWNLPDGVRRAVAEATKPRRTGGERVEAGGAADEATDDETGQDPADRRVGQATGDLLEGGGTGVAMVSMPGADLAPMVTPISFEINPRQPDDAESFVSVPSGLVNPVAIMNGTRLAGVQLVFGEVPSQQVDGAAGDREVRRAEGRTYPGGSTEGSLADPEVEVYLSSLGQLGAGAMRMTVANAGPSPVTLGGGAVVLEPVALLPADRQALDAAAEALPREAGSLIDAYCLDFLASPPDAGTVFRIAGAELQERFAPLRRILDASRQLQELGALSPDSDPAEYFHSIRQWAIWAEIEGLDQASFGASFVEQVKQNFDQAGQPWDDQARAMVEGLVPNRWKDVARVLEEAHGLATDRQAES